VPTLHLAVALGITRAGSDMGRSVPSGGLLEILGGKLGSVIGSNPRSGFGEPLVGPLENDLDVLFGHGFPEIPRDKSN
jgi:hypothetical protein